MKNFIKSIILQLVVIVATISGLITGLFIVVGFLTKNADVIYILSFSVPALIISAIFLYRKKITWEEFLAALWPYNMPW